MDDTVDAALHLLRQHFDEGGFLESLRGMFSGPDYLSTGEAASPTNWGDPELASDFFKADRALRLAREVQASEPDRDMPLPLRRPVAEAAPRRQVAAPPPAPAPAQAFRPVATLPIRDVDEPHDFPPVTTPSLAFGEKVYGEKTQRLGGDERQNRAPAVQMDYTLGHGQNLWPSSGNFKTLAGTVPENFNSRFGDLMSVDDARQSMMFRPEPRAEINRAVSLAQNLAPAQPEAIPSAADALAAVEKFQNAGIFSGNEYDKAGEILAAHNRAMFDSIPVEEALRLNRAAGPMMINQGMPREERRAAQPLAYTATPAPAPAANAIDQATGKLAARVDPNSDAERANNVWNRMLIQESGGRQFDRNGNTITSPAGAIGISQVMPSTGPEAARLAGLPWSLERLRTDPEYNHALGRAYYEAQLERFGDPTLAAAAYNGGPGRVAGALRQARETGRPWTAFLRPETQNYVRIVTAQPRAHGGLVDDALHVVRERHADGEAVGPTMQQRLRETIASIDPERSQDQPVMDPATMGEAWNRARQNYQNFPVQEGEAVARPLELGARDVIGGAIGGEPRAPGANFRRGVADLLVGNTGLPNSGTLGVGALDATRALGIPLTLADMAHDIGQGDYANAAMNAALPAAFYARGPLGAAGRRAVEIAKDYAKPAAAAATGVAGATVAPDEAEAGFVPKFITKGGSTTLQFPSGTPANTRLHGISGKGKLLLPQPLETYTAGFVPNKNLAPRTNVDWEKLEGGVAVPALWDRTIGGYTLESFGPHVLTNPKKLQGGTAYQRWGHLQPDQPAGASGSDVISRYIKRTQDAAKEGQPFLITSAMGNEGGDFSSMMYAPIIDVFRQNRGKIDNKLVAELDNGIRNKLFNDSKKIMGEEKAKIYADKWPGMDNPDLDTILAKMAGPYRSTMAKVMDKAKYRKGDMPDISALRFATTEPDLLHAPSLSTGYSVAKLDPRGIAMPSGHNDYDTAIRGLGYLGGAKTHIPWDMFWRDFAATRPAGENFAHTQKAFLTQMPLQKIDARLVDAIKKHEEDAVRRGNPFGND